MLSLHCNGSISFLFINATKIYHFKAKDSEIKPYPSCLGNTWKEKTELKGSVKDFSVDYNAIDTSHMLNIQRYLMKEAWYKMFGFNYNTINVWLH